MAVNSDLAASLDPWGTLWLVIQVVLPPVAFAFLFSFMVYVLFVVVISRVSAALGSKLAMLPAGGAPPAGGVAPVDFGYLLGPSYVVMT